MRSALNAIAVVAPAWLKGVAEGEWIERYSRLVEGYRRPRGEQARQEYGVQVGKDYAKLRAEAREQALERMVEGAAATGANAVVGMRFSTSMVMSGAAEMLAYGSAVSVE
jgi:uncharacterized protein YbjQ (UPF0145 family)